VFTIYSSHCQSLYPLGEFGIYDLDLYLALDGPLTFFLPPSSVILSHQPVLSLSCHVSRPMSRHVQSPSPVTQSNPVLSLVHVLSPIFHVTCSYISCTAPMKYKHQVRDYSSRATLGCSLVLLSFPQSIPFLLAFIS
jgi:hypothetical protein